MKIFLIKTTYREQKDAHEILNFLLEKRLVACGSVQKIKTAYIWEEKITQTDEFLLEVKALPAHKKIIIRNIRQTHPYAVPEVLIVRARACKKYAKWMKNVTRS